MKRTISILVMLIGLTVSNHEFSDASGRFGLEHHYLWGTALLFTNDWKIDSGDFVVEIWIDVRGNHTYAVFRSFEGGPIIQVFELKNFGGEQVEKIQLYPSSNRAPQARIFVAFLL